MVATQTQGLKSKAFTLDPAARLRQATDTTSGSETRRIINHHANNSDSPSWINTSTNAGSTWAWQRNVIGIDGSLAILQNPTGTPQLQIINPHGDIVATVDDSTAATSTNAYFEETEYGISRSVGPARYGWLGGGQRSIDDLGGLTLMGVRLYNPITGRFLTTDPIFNGNENDYNYPNDPINLSDTTGMATYWGGWSSYHYYSWASAGLPNWATVGDGFLQDYLRLYQIARFEQRAVTRLRHGSSYTFVRTNANRSSTYIKTNFTTTEYYYQNRARVRLPGLPIGFWVTSRKFYRYSQTRQLGVSYYITFAYPSFPGI